MDVTMQFDPARRHPAAGGGSLRVGTGPGPAADESRFAQALARSGPAAHRHPAGTAGAAAAMQAGKQETRAADPGSTRPGTGAAGARVAGTGITEPGATGEALHQTLAPPPRDAGSADAGARIGAGRVAASIETAQTTGDPARPAADPAPPEVGAVAGKLPDGPQEPDGPRDGEAHPEEPRVPPDRAATATIAAVASIVAPPIAADGGIAPGPDAGDGRRSGGPPGAVSPPARTDIRGAGTAPPVAASNPPARSAGPAELAAAAGTGGPARRSPADAAAMPARPPAAEPAGRPASGQAPPPASAHDPGEGPATLPVPASAPEGAFRAVWRGAGTSGDPPSDPVPEPATHLPAPRDGLPGPMLRAPGSRLPATGSEAVRSVTVTALAAGTSAGAAPLHPWALAAPLAGADTAAPAIAAAVGLQLAAAVTAGPGLTRLDMRLDPPELGHVRILLDMGDDNRLHATLIAERPATGDLMRRHAEVLTAQFREAGFGDVDLSFQQQLPGDRQGQRSAGGPGPALPAWLAQAAAPPPGQRPAPPRPAGADGTLDLRF